MTGTRILVLGHFDKLREKRMIRSSYKIVDYNMFIRVKF